MTPNVPTVYYPSLLLWKPGFVLIIQLFISTGLLITARNSWRSILFHLNYLGCKEMSINYLSGWWRGGGRKNLLPNICSSEEIGFSKKFVTNVFYFLLLFLCNKIYIVVLKVKIN